MPSKPASKAERAAARKKVAKKGVLKHKDIIKKALNSDKPAASRAKSKNKTTKRK